MQFPFRTGRKWSSFELLVVLRDIWQSAGEVGLQVHIQMQPIQIFHRKISNTLCICCFLKDCHSTRNEVISRKKLTSEPILHIYSKKSTSCFNCSINQSNFHSCLFIIQESLFVHYSILFKFLFIFILVSVIPLSRAPSTNEALPKRCYNIFAQRYRSICVEFMCVGYVCARACGHAYVRSGGVLYLSLTDQNCMMYKKGCV